MQRSLHAGNKNRMHRSMPPCRGGANTKAAHECSGVTSKPTRMSVDPGLLARITRQGIEKGTDAGQFEIPNAASEVNDVMNSVDINES